jgi:ligand-binding sensor domain-containing protein
LRRHTGVPAGDAVSAIHEDRRGTVWVAAGAQLYRFDGERTRRFGPTDGLPAGAIAALADDEDGSLWLGTPEGLARLHEERFQLYAGPDGLPEKDVTAVLVDREGSLWVGTRNGGLSQFTSRTLDTAGVPDEVGQSEVTSLIEDAAGAMWFALRDRGVVRMYQGRARKYTRADGLPSDQVWTVLPGQGELAGQPATSGSAPVQACAAGGTASFTTRASGRRGRCRCTAIATGSCGSGATGHWAGCLPTGS